MSSTIQRDKESYPSLSFPLYRKCAKIKVWVIGLKIVGLRDFQQLEDHLQHLEFKVWEHPNLKVRSLTLKDQFLKNCYCFHCLDLRCQHVIFHCYHFFIIIFCLYHCLLHFILEWWFPTFSCLEDCYITSFISSHGNWYKHP